MSKQEKLPYDQLTDILERISDGFIALDNNWCYKYMSKRAGEIVGRDPEEMVGKNMWEEFPELKKDSPDLHDAYMKAMKEQKSIALETYYKPFEKWFQTDIYPSPAGLTIYFKDITGKKKAEENLYKTKERLEAAEELAGLGSWEFDLSSQTMIWSKQIFRFFELQPAEQVPPYEEYKGMIHKDDREAFEEGFKKMLKGFDPQMQVYRTNPEVLPLRYLLPTIKVTRDDEGKPIKFSGTLLDITDRIKAGEEMRVKEKKYQSLVEQASDGIVIVDPSLQYIEVNSRFCQMMGYTRDELLKMTATEITVIETGEFPLQFEKMKKGKSIVQERKFRTRDGTLISVEISGSEIWDGNYIGIIRDISERKKAGEKLIQQENQLRLFIDQSPVALIMLDKEMRYLEASKKWTLDYNIGNKDIVGKSHYEIFPEIPAHWKEIHHRCLAGESVKKEEELFIRADGTEEWIHWEVHPWYKTSDEVGGIIIFSENITERKNAEKLIRESEEKYRSLIEQASDAIMITDTAGNFLDVNTSFCTMFGYTKKELSQINVRMMIDPEQLEAEPMRFDELLKGQHVFSLRRMLHKNGVIIEMEANVKMLPDGRVLAIARDISERKKAEYKLLESENRLRTILENEPECVKILNQKGEIIEMNPAGLSMIEADDLEIVKGRSVIEIIDESYRDAFSDLIKKIFKGETDTLVFGITGLKGTKRWLETHSVPMKNSEGEIVSLLGVTRDITKRKKAEEQIQKLNNELEEKVKARTAELEAANKDLEDINDLFVGREARIIELKEELEQLKDKLK